MTRTPSLRGNRRRLARPRRIAVLGLAALVAGGWAASGGVAQEPPRTLTLDQAVQAALTQSTTVKLADLALAARRGQEISTRGVFNPEIASSVGATRDLQPLIGPEGIGASPVEQNQTSYQLAMSKRLRWGAVVQPEVSVVHTDANALSPVAAAVATVNLGVSLPLLRDRWGVVSSSGERAAEALYSAEVHTRDHAAERSVLQVVTAYWQYVAAYRVLDVHRASEERARLLVDETRALVAEDERPTADLNHVLGNLASKRLTVLSAEQNVAAARRDLGLAMGLPAEAIAKIPAPTTDFPDTTGSPADLDLARLTTLALGSRSDLEAAGEQTRSAEILANAARSQLKPQLDVSLSVGYTGAQTGTGVGPLFSPLYSHVPGLSTSLSLSYDFPFFNDQGEGLAIQRQSLLDQARVAQTDLTRAITADVDVAVQALQRSVLSMDEIRQAVELNQATVEDEKAKHQLGVSTLFDVILAEDALTNVLLGEVQAHVEYVTALVSLRFNTGTLVEERDGRFVVPSGALISVP